MSLLGPSALSGYFTMSHRELAHRKVQAPRGVSLCSKSHPLDIGFERLLDEASLAKTVPNWIPELRQPTATE